MRQNPALPLLLVDTDTQWARTFALALECVGLNNIELCADSRMVLPILAGKPVEMVLLDVNMPGGAGENLLAEIRRRHPETPVLMVTAQEDVDVVVRCMQMGASNYLVKSTHKSQLVAMVHQTLSLRDLRRVHGRLSRAFFQNALHQPEAFADFITGDPTMFSLLQYLEAVAESPEPLLVTGETGTGKELVARALHRLSLRPGELVAVNVAGLDDEAFSDTLFGHVRGAFTGATERRGGLIERAEGGTLFLDEIGDLKPGSQVKLLRLLQEGEYLPLGADTPRRCDIRVVAATHHDLSVLQRDGGFRRDLYFRLRTHHVHLPPLRQRAGDIPLLAEHFLGQAAQTSGRERLQLSAQTMALLQNYSFPGNVRELRAMLRDAASRATTDLLEPELFDPALREHGEALPVRTGAELFRNVQTLPTLKEAQQMLIAEAMRRTQNNQAAAAQLIGVTRQAVNQRLRSGCLPRDGDGRLC